VRLRLGSIHEVPHFDVVLSNGFSGDDVDVGGTALVVAAADLLHVLGQVQVRLVLHVSHLLCIVPSPCFFVGPDSEKLLSCIPIHDVQQEDGQSHLQSNLPLLTALHRLMRSKLPGVELVFVEDLPSGELSASLHRASKRVQRPSARTPSAGGPSMRATLGRLARPGFCGSSDASCAQSPVAQAYPSSKFPGCNSWRMKSSSSNRHPLALCKPGNLEHIQAAGFWGRGGH
jgi:hypothetical protein